MVFSQNVMDSHTNILAATADVPCQGYAAQLSNVGRPHFSQDGLHWDVTGMVCWYVDLNDYLCASHIFSHFAGL